MVGFNENQIHSKYDESHILTFLDQIASDVASFRYIRPQRTRFRILQTGSTFGHIMIMSSSDGEEEDFTKCRTTFIFFHYTSKETKEHALCSINHS